MSIKKNVVITGKIFFPEEDIIIYPDSINGWLIAILLHKGMNFFKKFQYFILSDIAGFKKFPY